MITNEGLYKAPEGNPAPLKHSIEEYVNHGTPVGGFLHALLSNQFYQLWLRADVVNRYHLLDYGQLLADIPVASWGSPERVNEWISSGGLEGLNRKKEAS